MSWVALLGLAAGAYLFKLAGLLVGDRLSDSHLRRAVQLVPPAMFAALVALQTFEADGALVIDARVVGLVVAIIATLRKVPFVGVIVLAAAATALTRALL